MIRPRRFAKKVRAPFIRLKATFSNFKEAIRLLQNDNLCEAMDIQGWLPNFGIPSEGLIFTTIFVDRYIDSEFTRLGFGSALGKVVNRADVISQVIYVILTTECLDDLVIAWNDFNREAYLKKTVSEEAKSVVSTTIDRELFFLDAVNNLSKFVGAIEPSNLPRL